MNGLWKKSIVAALVLVGIAALGTGLGSLTLPAAPPPDQPAPAPDQEKPQAALPDVSGQTFTYAGRVLAPDSQPVAGAKVFVSGLKPGTFDFVPRTATGADGAFRFTIRGDEFDHQGVVPAGRPSPESLVIVGVAAAGFGTTAVSAGRPERRENITVWLPEEEIVRGRVVDLEGKPVAGAKVSAGLLSARMKDNKPVPFDDHDEPNGISHVLATPDPAPVTTDADGRFTLRGLARGWFYDLSISGPTIVTTLAQLVTRPEKPTKVPWTAPFHSRRGKPQALRYGSEFTHVAVPCKPIVGTVREKGTGQPIVGARVGKDGTFTDEPTVGSETDRDGKYNLTGLPRGVHTLTFRRPPSSPYLDAEVKVDADRPGIEPVACDIEVERQASASGRVTDAATGGPVRGWVEYRPLADNPNVKPKPPLGRPRGQWVPSTQLDRDGRFLLPVLPGPGVLLVHGDGDYKSSWLANGYRFATVAEEAPLARTGESHAYRLIDTVAGQDVGVTVTLEPVRPRP